MCDKVTDEASFIELCKEYCGEDQRETFEDPSASMAKNLKKSTISSQVSEDVAEWLFSADRAVGDKRTALAGDYAYVMMITKPAYRDEDALASARHILVSFAGVAEELAAEEAELTSEEESTEPTEDASVTEAPADETTSEAVTDLPETTTAASAEESTAPADETTTAADGKDEKTDAEDETDISGRGAYSAEVVLKAHDKAVSILEEYNAGEKTEDAFAALAEKYSDDTASLEEGGKTSGGLYEDITKGQMVEEFESWVYDPARQPGDVEIIETSYGWHIMYFVSRHDEPEWKESIISSIVSDLQKAEEETVADSVKDTAKTTFFAKLAGDQALKLVNKLYAHSASAES